MMFTLVRDNETLELARDRAIQAALLEDIGTGDLTAALVSDYPMMARVTVKQNNAVLCGQAWFDGCFKALDKAARIEWHVQEGETLMSGINVCTIFTQSRSLLSAERSALNFLQTLSSTATLTRELVAAIAGCSPNPEGCHILDTRKTLPGLRLAQKYAVRIGGGENQRLALWHGILIKENHIAACGGIGSALKAAQNKVQAQDSSQDINIQIEVESLEELREALKHGAMSILLDDFDLVSLREAVNINADWSKQNQCPKALLEASGGISLDNIREIARTGVDRISIGKITKDVCAVDYSLRIIN